MTQLFFRLRLPTFDFGFFCVIVFFVCLSSQFFVRPIFAAETKSPVGNKRNFVTTQRSLLLNGVHTIPRSVLDLDRIDLNCPVECACQRGYINCTSRSLRYVPAKNRRTNYTTFLPHAMWLNDNHFGTAISAKNFSDWLMLKTLSLRNCSVRRISAMTFSKMPRLAVLDLSFNRGGMLVDAFAFFGTNLEALLLDDNPGIVFSERAFENATIRSVRIRRCKLTTISPDVFLALSGSIESLIASENQITSLNHRFESLFTSISFFDVSKNPWICDCAVEWLVRVFVNRLNRTRSLNPVDEWGSASGHGLPVPTCATPSQRSGMLIDLLRLGTNDFACSAASVIGIDVDQLRERNQTRFRCSAAGDPVAAVSWHFPRVEDEYNWALSLVENTTTVVSPNAYTSSSSSGIVVVSQAFLTVLNRPAISASNGFSGSSNQVRLVCKAVNSLGSASLMTNFDVTQRQPEVVPGLLPKTDHEIVKLDTTISSKVFTQKKIVTPTISGRPISAAVTQRPKSGDVLVVTPQKLLTDILTKQTKTTNIPIGYDDDGTKKGGGDNIYDPIWVEVEGTESTDAGAGDAEAEQQTVTTEDNGTATTAVVTKWQEGENVGMNQQSIPQGILVTVAVLIAIVMSSLGGCCLVIACSTSKVPNCPNLKRAPSRYRGESGVFVQPSTVALPTPQHEVPAPPHPKSSLQDRRPLLKPRYNSADIDEVVISKQHSSTSKPSSSSKHEHELGGGGQSQSQQQLSNHSHSNHNHNQSQPFLSENCNNNRHSAPYSPPQTFSTFRSANVALEKSEKDADPEPPRPVLLSAFPGSSSKSHQSSPRRQPKHNNHNNYQAGGSPRSRDDAYFDQQRNNEQAKRRYQTYYGRGHRSNVGLTLFLSPPPPAPPPVLDGIALENCGAEINRNSSNSYPGDMICGNHHHHNLNHHHHHHNHERFLSNSQSELCTCSPDFNKDKKSSSGYRSMVLNGAGSDDLDASAGTTSGVRSSEPGDEFAMVHPVACFSPVHGNDIVRKTCLPVATEEITFI